VLFPRPVPHVQYTCHNKQKPLLMSINCLVYVPDAAYLLRGTNWTLQRQTSNIKHINHSLTQFTSYHTQH